MRGYPPGKGQHSLIIEVEPALSINRIADIAFKTASEMKPRILFTERQFRLLKLHADDYSDLEKAGKAILKGIGAKHSDQMAPKVLCHDIIRDMSDQHAIIMDRSTEASILVPDDLLGGL